jgi:hypothetical protein
VTHFLSELRIRSLPILSRMTAFPGVILQLSIDG